MRGLLQWLAKTESLCFTGFLRGIGYVKTIALLGADFGADRSVPEQRRR